MLRITSDAFHEKVNSAHDEIILNGPPSDLRGKMIISNPHDESVKLKSLPLVHGKILSKTNGSGGVLQVSCKLNPGEQNMTDIFHEVNPFTPAGTYESVVMVGGKQKKVKMVVQPQIKIELQPHHFTLLGSEPGKVHTLESTLSNLGNVDFQVPEVKHVAALDMDLICRALGMAMRGKGNTGYEKVLDDISKNVQAHLPDWAGADVLEKGKILAPGDIMVIHLKIRMPRNCDPSTDYVGNLRFWDQDISYTIKSHNHKTKTK